MKRAMGSHGTFDSNIPKSRVKQANSESRVFTKIASSDSIFFIPMTTGVFCIYIYIIIYIPGFFFTNQPKTTTGRGTSRVLFSPFGKALLVQLRHFHLDSTQCWCCEVNHVDPSTSEPVMCDREVLESCIDETWLEEVSGHEFKTRWWFQILHFFIFIPIWER